MRRFSIHALAVMLLGAAVFAQQDLRSRLRLKSQVKYAGIYHYGLGTWTRPGALNTELGPVFSTIYNNTCSSAYFAACYPGELWTDEGRLPSPNSPDKIFSESQASTGVGFVGTVDECPEGPSSAPGSAKGSAASYAVEGFQIGYCSQAVGATTDITIAFRGSTVLDPVRCAEKLGLAPPPLEKFQLSGLPGNAGGPFGCWAVAIDLAAASFSFGMPADGTGDYSTPARSADLFHLFSWTFSFPSDPGPTGTAASGFLLTGNPANAAPLVPNGTLGMPNTNGWRVLDTAGHPGVALAGYDGTVWDKHGANPLPSMFNGGNNGSRGSFAFISAAFTPGIEDGTGMSTQDCVRIDNPTGNPLGGVNGSYWFGGPQGPPLGAVNPFASFHLELYTTDSTLFVSPPGTGFCYGNGCAFTCPCTGAVPNPQGHHESGCANGNAFGNTGSFLTTSGSANPFATENVRIDCVVDEAAPFVTPLAIGIKGNARLENGFFPTNAYDGARCVDGGLIRFASHFVGSAVHGEVPGAWHYPTTVANETFPLSIKSVTLNGETAWYQVLHRNSPPIFCNPSAAINWSNGMIIKWGAP